MKTIPVSLILLAWTGVGLICVHAEGPGHSPPPPGDPHEEFLKVWNRIDTNRDGKVSPEEFAMMPRVKRLPEAKREGLFVRLDQNQDGVLGRDEIHRLVEKRPHGGMPRIWELDKDKDGGVSFEEFCEGEVFRKFDPKKQKRIFSHLDSDGDGRITRQDRPKRRPHGRDPGGRPGPPPDQRFGQLDMNNDGKLSWEEFQQGGPKDDPRGIEMKRKRFDRLDEDGDGFVSLEEFKAVPRNDRRPPPCPLHGPNGAKGRGAAAVPAGE